MFPANQSASVPITVLSQSKVTGDQAMKLLTACSLILTMSVAGESQQHRRSVNPLISADEWDSRHSPISVTLVDGLVLSGQAFGHLETHVQPAVSDATHRDA